MDSTNGHSEKNQQKKIEDLFEGIKFESIGEPEKIDISQLPYEEQEKIREMMDTMGQTEPPDMYKIDVSFEMKYLELFPIDVIADQMANALSENRFEDAEEISKVLKEKNYNIEITDKKLILTYNKDNEEAK